MQPHILKEAGLTEGEAKVYLALLELGASTTGPIIEKSKIARSIIYLILEKLIEKGLVSFVTKEKTKYYQASDPQKLIEYVEEKEKAFANSKKKIAEVLPQLALLSSMAQKNEVSVYTGINGMRTAHEKIYSALKKGDEYCIIGLPAYQPEVQLRYWRKDHIRRARGGIKCRLLFNYDTPQKEVAHRNSLTDCQARLMKLKIITPASFMTYKDTTLILIQDPEYMAVEIINEGITKSFQNYFEVFWKS